MSQKQTCNFQINGQSNFVAWSVVDICVKLQMQRYHLWESLHSDYFTCHRVPL